jgi:hypothetical protein
MAHALRAAAPAAAFAPRATASSSRTARLAAPPPRQRARGVRFAKTRAAATLSEEDDIEFRGSNAPLALLRRCDALADPGAPLNAGGLRHVAP